MENQLAIVCSQNIHLIHPVTDGPLGRKKVAGTVSQFAVVVAWQYSIALRAGSQEAGYRIVKIE